MYLISKMKDNIHNPGNIPAQVYTYVMLVLLSKWKVKKSKTKVIVNHNFIISCDSK